MQDLDLLYEEASADAAEVHKRPALAEAPGGFTQMPAALKQAAAQLSTTTPSRASSRRFTARG